MNKGIVVVDVPENCYDCEYTFNKESCELTNWLDVKQYISTDTKPDWCPIIPLPEKIHYQSRHSIDDEQFASGWNACIDEILGE